MIENLYQNPIFSIALTILALVAIANSGLQIYMLNGPPILIEKDLTGTRTAYGSGAAAYACGPFIYMNPTDENTKYRILRHEYQHYMQAAILSPIGMAIGYYWEQLVMGKPYHENLFELDAFRAEKNLITFKVFDWNLKQVLEVKP